MERWPHQIKARQEFHAAVERGEKVICITTPTGGGKTLTLGDIIKDYLDKQKRVVLYVNKKMLTQQNADAMGALGLEHGIRADGHDTDLGQRFQIASMQTEHSRANRFKTRSLHKADLVAVEECHVQTGPTAKAIIDQHKAEGAVVVGITATPLDIGDMYEHLIVAGTNSELRDCGALVPAIHFGADEPDLKAMKIKEPDGDNPNAAAQKKAIMTPTIFARVGEWFEKLNPEHKPTVLFGPGVLESFWFAEQFYRKGISSAHIDGDSVWINGRWMQTTTPAHAEASRREVAEGSRNGSIKVVCNRYVLREGVNWPWICHGILAYVVGTLQTYLQIGGRFLRAFPGKSAATIQDHGGAWHRFGSLNADRHWDLSYTNSIVAGMRADRMRTKVDKEPWRCPKCGQIMSRSVCVCGHEMPPKKSRPVVQADGSLREMTGDIYRPRTTYSRPDGKAIWEKMFWRSRTEKGARTFRAAMALFARESMERGKGYCWPDPTWPFMPVQELDKYRLVADVPRERLR